MPRPTFRPGLMGVPLCRTRMEPALTVWPPWRLTPSLLPELSLPFRALPPDFLWAIGHSLVVRFGLAAGLAAAVFLPTVLALGAAWARASLAGFLALTVFFGAGAAFSGA